MSTATVSSNFLLDEAGSCTEAKEAKWGEELISEQVTVHAIPD